MSRQVLILVLAGALPLAAACAPAAPAPEAEAPAPVTSLYEPVVELADVMNHVVNYNATMLWNVGLDGNVPETDEDWAALEASAVALAAAGGITGLGGSGDFDQEWLTRATPNPTEAPRAVWERFSQALSDAGLRATQAVRARDVEQVEAAGSELVVTCINCHREYRLEVPDDWEGDVPTGN